MSIKLLCNFNHERVFGQRKIITDSNGPAVFMARSTPSHPITNHPFFKNLYPRTNIEYYFAKNVGIIQLKITGFNFNNNADKTHNWNIKYYKIIN
jgi:hypothetical protein